MSERVVTSGWAVLPIEEPTEGVWTPIVWDSEEAEEGQESVFVVTDRRAFARLLCAQVNDPHFRNAHPSTQAMWIKQWEARLKAIGMVHPSEEPATDD